MSDQVGFSFQADVVNTASMGHVITGRLLKALSDGGVDTYATWSTIQLGKLLTTRSSLQTSVYSHIASKTSYKSVLSKALSIGWGHSAPIADLARSVAGTNAILLIGALSTGSPPFGAAQCLSELMSIYGLEADMVPSVDVLKGLIVYLAPYVQDLGFSKVLQHITILAENNIRSQAMKGGFKLLESINDLQKLGGAAAWAGAIKQLIFTSQRGEQHFMVLKMRGSWLPAFASHILGMSVELRFNEQLIWASGGDQGSVTFQLGETPVHNWSINPHQQPAFTFTKVEQENNSDLSISIEYPLGDALEAQLLRFPQIDACITKSIHAAITFLSRQLLISHQGSIIMNEHLFQAQFNKAPALARALQSMRIEATVPDGKERIGIFESPKSPGALGISCLDLQSLEMLIGRCFKDHPNIQMISEDFCLFETKDPSYYYLCEIVGRLIQSFATTAIALALCRFEPDELRVQDDIISGYVTTEWNHTFINPDSFPTPFLQRIHLSYLGRLICGGVSAHSNRELGEFTLGVSGGAYTIYLACIMETDCYDELGRMVNIRSGRMSVNGSFRSVIAEKKAGVGHETESSSGINESAYATCLAGGAIIEPHYRPSEANICMDVILEEKRILLRLGLASKSTCTVPITFEYCIRRFLTIWSNPRCDHPVKSPYKVPKDHDLAVAGFRMTRVNWGFPAEVFVFALRGNKLEQLVTCGIMSETKWSLGPLGEKFGKRGVVQSSACLKCCLNLANQPDYLPCVVMGG